MKTAFIGGGNMATALIAGLDKTGPASTTVSVCDPSEEVRERLVHDYGIRAVVTASEATSGSECIVLAVKPQVMPMVLEELANVIQPGQLVISVAAGTSVQTIRDALGSQVPVIRCMPNTPALLGLGITGLFAGPGCTPEQMALAEAILGAVGETVVVEDESLMDVVTAVSGSGPAYFYLMTEALREAGEALGLPGEVAAELARHTAHGAGVMAAQSGLDVAELRHRVTSPGGTTQAALEALQEGGFAELLARAVQAAAERGRELSGAEQQA